MPTLNTSPPPPPFPSLPLHPHVILNVAQRSEESIAQRSEESIVPHAQLPLRVLAHAGTHPHPSPARLSQAVMQRSPKAGTHPHSPLPPHVIRPIPTRCPRACGDPSPCHNYENSLLRPTNPFPPCPCHSERSEGGVERPPSISRTRGPSPSLSRPLPVGAVREPPVPTPHPIVIPSAAQ